MSNDIFLLSSKAANWGRFYPDYKFIFYYDGKKYESVQDFINRNKDNTEILSDMIHIQVSKLTDNDIYYLTSSIDNGKIYIIGNDEYWGVSFKNGVLRGKNMLGKILKCMRKYLRKL